jgi:transcriptional regulator with XRE-family HTH domain
VSSDRRRADDLDSLGSPSDEQVSQVVGERVRSVRHALGLTMAQLAKTASVSTAMLSRIENGLTSPSLSTLNRLARAANVPITSFFRGLDEEHDAVLVRAGKGQEIIHAATSRGRRYQDLGALRGPTREIEPVLVTLTKPDTAFPLFQHPGVELIHVLEGSMEYGYGSNRYVLEPGDTLQIRGEVAHGPTRLIDLPVEFLSLKVHGLEADDSGR